MSTEISRGDIVFTAAHGGGPISRAILWADQAEGEKPTLCSHTAVVTDIGTTSNNPYLVTLREQTWPGIRTSGLSKYLDAGASVYIYRDLILQPRQTKALVQAARDQTGPYGAGKILLFLIDAILSKLTSKFLIALGKLFGRSWRGIEFKLFSRLDLSGTVVCSQWIARLLYHAHGPKSGTSLRALRCAWQTYTPDKLMDEFCRNPARYKLIWTNDPYFLR